MLRSLTLAKRRYNQYPYGHRFLLGKRQPTLLAGSSGARIQGPVVQQPPAAFRPAGAQVAADAGDELPRQAARFTRRRLRRVRVAGDSLLPRPEISRPADLRPHTR